MQRLTAHWQRLDMDDTYSFTSQWIDEVVAEGYAGCYVLGNASGERFEARFVGRSDSDVHKELRAHALKDQGSTHNQYKHFKYGLAVSAQAAFDIECQVYHEAGGRKRLDNTSHPSRPKHSEWKCPVQDCHDLD